MMTKNLAHLFLLGSLLHVMPACMGDDPADLEDNDLENQDDTKADAAATTPTVTSDQLNGQWQNNGKGDEMVMESWGAIGIRLHVGATVYSLTRTGDNLTGDNVTLAVKANKAGIRDDVMDGTIAGQTVHLQRDTSVKAPIVVNFPGNEPYRVWLQNTILPLAQQDRESFHKFDHNSLYTFLTSCELYKHGSWLRTYMKGDTWSDQAKSFNNIMWAMDGQYTSPHAIVGNYTFSQAVQKNLKDPTKIGLALSSFGMYFSTAAGGALRFPMASDSTAYFITDRPARAELLGLVVMNTPTHGPLASTFGRQLLDMGAMPAADSPIYARALMNLLAKSDNKLVQTLSATGRSAMTDWFSVMSIEDYRGVAFGDPGLGWGYNMTNVQFYGLLVRSLARPGTMDSAGNPVIGQVIVGSSLQPGDPSYADVLNGGNDMQEYPDMARLKTLATSFLRAHHADAVLAVENAFAGVEPKAALDYRAQQDIFHFITAELYDARTSNLTGASADAAVTAVGNLFDTLQADSANFEAYILANGIIKSTTPAPKSTGF
jgi:hypothetical protein